MAFAVLLASLICYKASWRLTLGHGQERRLQKSVVLFDCIKLELNTVHVIYSGPTDVAGVTSSAENEEHSQIIIHCTPSTGMPCTSYRSFLLSVNVRQTYLKVVGRDVIFVTGVGLDDVIRPLP